MYIATESATDSLTLRLQGRWRAEAVDALEQAVLGLPAAAGTVVLDARQLESLDLTGGWLLRVLERRLLEAGASLTWQPGRPETLGVIDDLIVQGAPAAVPDHSVHPIMTLGRWTVVRYEDLVSAVEFLGRIYVVLWQALRSPRHLRLTSVVRHVYETGVAAIPIVSLIAFLISVIVAYIGAQQLRNFGGEIFVVDLITLSVLRELGVLLTAIIVAGRSGSAFAAEIGVMRLNEEVDALQAMGVNPTEVLVLPRLLGLVIAMPLLTVIADGMGLAGGAVLSWLLVDIPFNQFMVRVQEALAPTTFWVGVIKAPVFGFLIALIGTYRGTQVRGSSRELGRLTTVAVVQSIFMVIFADAIFAVIFMELDI